MEVNCSWPVTFKRHLVCFNPWANKQSLSEHGRCRERGLLCKFDSKVPFRVSVQIKLFPKDAQRSSALCITLGFISLTLA